MTQWRDLGIIVFTVAGTAFMIFVVVIMYSTYTRVRRILREIETTATIFRQVSSFAVDEVIKPFASISAIIQGFKEGMNGLSGMSSGRKGDE